LVAARLNATYSSTLFEGGAESLASFLELTTLGEPKWRLSLNTVSSGGAFGGAASSASGRYIVAARIGGYLYVSKDGGSSWVVALGDIRRYWYGVTCSSSGQYMAAASSSRSSTAVPYWDNRIYVSDDHGDTWMPRGPFLRWRAVTSSATGQYLAAIGDTYYVYRSSDFGGNWNRAPYHPNPLASIASSSDGRNLVAVGDSSIIVSQDFGGNWTTRGPSLRYSSVASSRTGQYLVAVTINELIYSSSDGGTTWIGRGTVRDRRSVSISASGQYAVTGSTPEGGTGGRVEISRDFGVSWAESSPNREARQGYFGIAISASGRFVVATANVAIYTGVIPQV